MSPTTGCIEFTNSGTGEVQTHVPPGFADLAAAGGDDDMAGLEANDADNEGPPGLVDASGGWSAGEGAPFLPAHTEVASSGLGFATGGGCVGGGGGAFNFSPVFTGGAFGAQPSSAPAFGGFAPAAGSFGGGGGTGVEEAGGGGGKCDTADTEEYFGGEETGAFAPQYQPQVAGGEDSLDDSTEL